MSGNATTDPRPEVVDAVKRVAIAESRLAITPAELAVDEPLAGSVLTVTSFGFLGMLMRLEDEVGVQLPDDLFLGRTFTTLADLIEVVDTAAREVAS